MSDVPTENRTAPASYRRSLPVRAVRVFGWTCIGVGLFLLGFIVQQIFVTTYFAERNNEVLEAEAVEYFDDIEVTEVPYSEFLFADPVPPDEDGPVPVVRVESDPPDHEAFAIIRIPTIDRLKDGWAVVQGVTLGDLKNGAGHMTSTPLPGQPGNAVISGHRTTHGAPFHELDQLEPGDFIEVETGLGVHTYAVRESIVVRPTEMWVTQPREGAWLTLTTCHPKFSSRQRFVVFAELVEGPNVEAIYG